jgi:hypothetical protein
MMRKFENVEMWKFENEQTEKMRRCVDVLMC